VIYSHHIGGDGLQELTALTGITVAIAIGAASPGPSFVMVARTSVSLSRADGLAAALGMGVGGLFFACLSLLGLQSVLLAVPSLYVALKVAGGLYLAWLGIQIWRGANNPLPERSVEIGALTRSTRRSMLLALTTQLSNPKAAIVYASVFAAFLPPVSSLAFNVSVAALVFVIETGWYAVVAMALSSARPRAIYLRCKAWIDRAAGGVMIALGLRLVTSARS
jgi:threonine/homoserine/homoserine lactone efflux protein